jgi:putative DNA primase/helicase
MTQERECPGQTNRGTPKDTAEGSMHQDTLGGTASGDFGGDDWHRDAYIGEHLADRHLAGKYLCSGAFGWMQFDGRRWKGVDDAIVFDVIRRALIEMHQTEAKNGAGPDRLKKISGLLSANRIRAIQVVAKGHLGARGEDFDAHPDLLNVRNGVVDLRTGKLRPHDPDLMLTKVTLVDYVPSATHHDWDHALAALPADAADWMKVRLGQGLTGHAVPDDRAVVLRGSGENGKTTVVDAVRETLGPDYAVTLSDRVLLPRVGDHPTELMDLRGARLALVEEFPELGHLNVKRLKDLHGTGEMKARHCGKDTVHWRPTHTMFITTNYQPRVDESDHGTWRRLALVEFPYRYRYRKRHERLERANDRVGDPGLRERLRNGGNGRHEAVLAWLVAGTVRWYANDKVMPVDPSASANPPRFGAGV